MQSRLCKTEAAQWPTNAHPQAYALLRHEMMRDHDGRELQHEKKARHTKCAGRSVADTPHPRSCARARCGEFLVRVHRDRGLMVELAHARVRAFAAAASCCAVN